MAESIGGRVYAVATDSGAVDVWLADERLRPPPGVRVPGANGIKVFGGHAYVSSTAHDRIYRAPVAEDGSAGALSLLADDLHSDDFAFGVDGDLFVATHPTNTVVRLAPNGRRVTLGDRSQGVVCPTAVAFGRLPDDERGIYVTAAGGVTHVAEDEIQEARLLWLDVATTGVPLQVVR